MVVSRDLEVRGSLKSTKFLFYKMNYVLETF